MGEQAPVSNYVGYIIGDVAPAFLLPLSMTFSLIYIVKKIIYNKLSSKSILGFSVLLAYILWPLVYELLGLISGKNCCQFRKWYGISKFLGEFVAIEILLSPSVLAYPSFVLFILCCAGPKRWDWIIYSVLAVMFLNPVFYWFF
jgi:hypothetical protein